MSARLCTDAPSHLGFSAAAAGDPSGAGARPFCHLRYGRTWAKVPAIVVVSASANDARLPLVRDAVAFWNGTFAELGSAFRLGPVTEAAGTVPDDELRAISDRVLSRTGPAPFPESLRGVTGDLILTLSDDNFISFGMRWPGLAKALVAIKSDRF